MLAHRRCPGPPRAGQGEDPRHGVRPVLRAASEPSGSTSSSPSPGRKATFYKYFPSKDDLVVAYLDKVDGVWSGQLRQRPRPRAGARRPARRAVRRPVDRLPPGRVPRLAPSSTPPPSRSPAPPSTTARSRIRRRSSPGFRGLAQRAGAQDPAALARSLTLLLDGGLASGSLDAAPRRPPWRRRRPEPSSTRRGPEAPSPVRPGPHSDAVRFDAVPARADRAGGECRCGTSPGRTPRSRDGIQALVGATATWGSTFVVTKSSLDELAPATFLVWRFGVAALVLLVVTFRPGRPCPARTCAAPRVVGALLGSGFLLQTTGLQDTSAGLSGFLTGASVVMVPLVASVVFGRGASAGWWRSGSARWGSCSSRADWMVRSCGGSAADAGGGCVLRRSHHVAGPVGHAPRTRWA